MQEAPGRPGIGPRGTSSDKDGVGTALSSLSRVWFTISHGILNEIYYPRVDQACTRDLGLLVSDGAGFFSEEKRDTNHVVARLEDGVPAFKLTNTCAGGRYRIVKRIVSDPRRDVVLQSIRCETMKGGPLRLFALLSPHLVNGGAHNRLDERLQGMADAVRRRAFFSRARRVMYSLERSGRAIRRPTEFHDQVRHRPASPPLRGSSAVARTGALRQ